MMQKTDNLIEEKTNNKKRDFNQYNEFNIYSFNNSPPIFKKKGFYAGPITFFNEFSLKPSKKRLLFSESIIGYVVCKKRYTHLDICRTFK